MTILDTTREIAQDTCRELQISDGWEEIIETLKDSPLGLDEDVARSLLGL